MSGPKDPLSTEARIALRHLSKRVEADARTVSRIMRGKTEFFEPEHANTLAFFGALPPKRRLLAMVGAVAMVEDRTTTFHAATFAGGSSRQLGFGVVGPMHGFTGHAMAGANTILTTDVTISLVTVKTMRSGLRARGPASVAVLGWHALGRMFERANLTTDQACAIIKRISDRSLTLHALEGPHDDREFALDVGHGLIACGTIRPYWAKAVRRTDYQEHETPVVNEGSLFDVRTFLTEDMPNAPVDFARRVEAAYDGNPPPNVTMERINAIPPLPPADRDYATKIIEEHHARTGGAPFADLAP